MCVQISCVSRDSMPCCIVFGIDIGGGGGEREERGNNVSFARMVTIADRKPGNSGRRNGRGGKVERPNKVVFIFMSF